MSDQPTCKHCGKPIFYIGTTDVDWVHKTGLDNCMIPTTRAEPKEEP